MKVVGSTGEQTWRQDATCQCRYNYRADASAAFFVAACRNELAQSGSGLQPEHLSQDRTLARTRRHKKATYLHSMIVPKLMARSALISFFKGISPLPRIELQLLNFRSEKPFSEDIVSVALAVRSVCK